MQNLNLLGSGQLDSGTDFEDFKKSRTAFEDATLYVEIDFRVRPARILLFDGFEEDYILFIGVSGEGGEVRMKCKIQNFPKGIVDEISRREIPYIINVGNLNMLVKENTLQQLARRLQLSRIKLKMVSPEAAREIATALNKRNARVALRKSDRMYLFINVYTQNVMHKSMVPVVDRAIKQTGYKLLSWNMEQEKTSVILKGNEIYEGVFPVLEITFSDMLSFSEELRFGVATAKNPFILYMESLEDIDNVQEVVKRSEDLLKKNGDAKISYYANFNKKYEKLVGKNRMDVITHSEVKDIQKVSECVPTLLYTVKQVGEIPFSTENSLFEIGKELKKQLTKN